ncbi:hypothetical protein JTB14_014841 [Gonioctena quinquepunctata]|nr:hypothetical protein JTB14_014841 [Gonioctena quinquepunctata]
MDRKEIERIEQMMHEVSTPDTEESCESEAFSADDDIADPNYMSENEFPKNSSDDSLLEDNDRDETVSQNDDAPTGHVTGNDELSDDERQDDISVLVLTARSLEYSSNFSVPLYSVLKKFGTMVL